MSFDGNTMSPTQITVSEFAYLSLDYLSWRNYYTYTFRLKRHTEFEYFLTSKLIANFI